MLDNEKKEIELKKEIEEKKVDIKIKKEKCPKCSSDIVEKVNKKTNHRFFGCSGYPNCTYIKRNYEKIGKSCPECTKDLVLRENKEKQLKFIGCLGYPDCRYTLNFDAYNDFITKNPDEPLPTMAEKARDFSKAKRSFNNQDENGNKKSFKDKKSSNNRAQDKQSFTGFNEKVVKIKRISKTTKGGRSMRFSALVIIGDKKGLVGFGIGKSIEVPVAIRKALKDAKNNLVKVKITKKGTLFHEIIGKQGAGKVLLKPAPEGTGIIAGGPIRVALELAGFTDVYSKNLGKNTSLNMVRATVNGLIIQKTPKDVAELRDKLINNL